MKRLFKLFSLLTAIFFFAVSPAFANDLTYPINLITPDGIGGSVGNITIENSDYGLLITPDVKGLAPGVHGFHIHANASCDAAEKDGQLVPGLRSRRSL